MLLQLHFPLTVLQEEHQNNARSNCSITTSEHQFLSHKSLLLISAWAESPEGYVAESLVGHGVDLGLFFSCRVRMRAMVLVSLSAGRSD